MVESVDRGRRSFGTQGWKDAYVQLAAAEREGPLELDDLERLAVAAHLAGHDEESADAWTRAHHEALRRGDTARAVRCAFWLGLGLLRRGEESRGSGWFSRAQRLLDDNHEDCVEQGYLLVWLALQAMADGDAAAAHAHYDEAAKIGGRFGDADLVTLASSGVGEALVALGEVAEGMALFDEVMVSMTSGEASSLVAGIVYCAVIATCQTVFDLRRAQAWTAALSRWCESQPDLAPYRGQCLVHRAEIMQVHGEWRDAADEAGQACERLAGQPAVGGAFYQKAELHRLRGEFVEAEEAYREANKSGRQPQPGLAQLRLAQGHVEAAHSAIRRLVDEAQDRGTRAKVLAACVEIVLAANDRDAARAAADELMEIAADLDALLLQAISAHAQAAVLLAEGEPRSAIAELRRAWAVWQELDAPYEAARVRVLLGQAFRALGDEDSAEMEWDAARWVFQQLAAVPDLASLEALSRAPAAKTAGGLTAREVQVLALVATGKTNRRSPRTWSSASTPSAGTSRTSSPSSVSRRARRQAPTRSPTTSSEPRVVGNHHPAAPDLADPSDARLRSPSIASARSVDERDQARGSNSVGTQQAGAALDVGAVEELSERFAQLFRTFDVGDDVFSSDVFVDLNVPSWRFQLQGPEPFAAHFRELAENVDGEVRLNVLRTVPTRSGFVTEHEEFGDLAG